MNHVARRALNNTIVALIVVASTGCAATMIESSDRAPTFEETLDRQFAPWEGAAKPGAAIVVVQGGDVVYRKGVGVVAPESDVRIDPATTIFDIASVSKQFTAFAALLLEQEGALDLDVDVGEYLPWFPDFGAPITARHLLHHTSGLREYSTLASLEGEPYLADDPFLQEDGVEMIKVQHRLNFLPGTDILYTNANYTVLAELVETLSGQTFQSFLKEKIFELLGMRSTQVVERDGSSSGYVGKKQTEGMLTWGESGVLTTVDDLSLWARHLLAPKIYERATKNLFERGRLSDGTESIYGRGLEYGERRGVETVAHGGSFPGIYIASFTLLPSLDSAVIILGAEREATSRDGPVLEALLEDLGVPKIEEPAEDVSASEAAIFENPEAWAGTYVTDFDEFNLAAEDGKVIFRSGIREYEIEPTSDGRFLWPRSTRFVQARQEGGSVQGIEVKQGLTMETYRRVPAVGPEEVDFAAYAGTYRSDEIDSEFEIVAREDHLEVAHDIGIFKRFHPVGEDLFRSDYQKWLFRFHRDEEGEVAEMQVDTARVRDLRYARVETAAARIAESTANGFIIRRGTNISHWLSQSGRRGAERRQFFTEEDVALIKRLGYDHIRLPVDEEQLWDEQGRPQEEAFQLLDAALDWSAAHDLRAIVDLHILRSHHFNHEEKPLWTDPREQDRFVDLWRQLSERLGERPVDQVAYELMNEAVADDPEDWNRLLARGIAAVRELEPERTLVIGSNRWQQVETFDQLRVPEGDPNILLSFHFYTPMALTHYGASWTPVGRYQGPVRYPGRLVEEKDLVGLPDDLVAAIRDGRGLDFDRDVFVSLLSKPLALARKMGLPLYCGEWGALPAAPRDDRMRWYRDVRSVLEEHGIGWAHWDYKGGFGVVDREGNVHDELVRVLLSEDFETDPPSLDADP